MMFDLGLIDHVEGPRQRRSGEVFDEVAHLVQLADCLGVKYAWFAEHHAHAHYGHLPAPLLLALHLAGRTSQIRLGPAVVCLNLHHAVNIAEQMAVADILCCGRLVAGFGSGSTPEEQRIFIATQQSPEQRYERFAESLRVIRAVWAGRVRADELRYVATADHEPLPVAVADLPTRSWVAVNSVAAAAVAGSIGFNVLLSHLRTCEEHREYLAAYRRHGGGGHVAANFPIYVGKDDNAAIKEVEPALRLLWRRFQAEGKIATETCEPGSVAGLCGHPINFLVGGPATVARSIRAAHARCPFDVANVEVRWEGLGHEEVCDSLRRLVEDVLPRCGDAGK
jgi:alkanesulfonate monooxygenase SsuD/methylene tetrahydromethanopterin reductase-like flavin-dependent oxidoreductase (luciferase family)